MTAEIVIMNKNAVALAADSAVTIGVSEKIYNSANKLFSLSFTEPVGVMVYGNAELLDTPWETTIKEYRRHLGSKKLKYLKSYADNFITWLDKNRLIFPDTLQAKFVEKTALIYLMGIKEKIDDQLKDLEIQKGGFSKKDIEQVVKATVQEHQTLWKNTKYLAGCNSSTDKELLKKYENTLQAAKKSVFEKLTIAPDVLNKLYEILCSLFTKERFPPSSSGIVIAGFGDDEHFPSLLAYTIQGIALDKLIYRKDHDATIDHENTATIIPFAQTEMVGTFMEGIDPDQKKSIEGYLTQFFDSFPDYVASAIKNISEKERKVFQNNLSQYTDKLRKELITEWEKLRNRKHVNPIVQSVSVLPKDELAAMAESLVNITSFKRKISFRDKETVGGPIDVAVVSKGDGFIWIKRKHYFNPELNPKFLSRYQN